MSVRAVLLDSGGVLVRPIGGRWNPRADFERVLAAHAGDLPAGRLSAAIEAGDRFLAGTPGTPSRDDYHRAVLEVLGVAATPELLAALDGPVDWSEVVEPYPDALGALERLQRRGMRLAVVSDAWAELPSMHAAIGLGGWFEAYAISEVVGCVKPDARMFAAASDALGLRPDECLFVDDAPLLVAGAMALGYRGTALLRGGGPPAVDVPWITSLDEL